MRWILAGIIVASAVGALRGAEPAPKPAVTARRLANAIDLYLKEVEAAEKAKAAAEKLVATYEATIKRARELRGTPTPAKSKRKVGRSR